MPKVLSLMTMAVLAISTSSCAVAINDAQFCSPMPGGVGAVCDWFLSSNQQILTGPQWSTLQDKWQSSGLAVECTTSKTLGDLKKELEKLCSLAPCDYAVKQQIVNGLNKIQALGRTNEKL